ncbi:MAG TPA: winged helix-turn-helix transcriptional regulator [Myxococcota bacterium]
MSDEPADEQRFLARVEKLRTSAMHHALDVVGEPWIWRILIEVARGSHRYEELVVALALSRATLAKLLRHLVTSELLATTPSKRGSTRRDYRLTDDGESMVAVVLLFRQWNATHRKKGVEQDARPRHLPCGHLLELDLTCAVCDEVVDARAVRALDFAPRALTPSSLPRVPRHRRTRRPITWRGAPGVEDLLADRWTTLLIGALLFGLERFSELMFAFDIAPNILSSRLRLLTSAGLLARHDSDGYRLTERGLALYPSILALLSWSERRTVTPWAQRAGWNRLHKPCAHWLETALLCRACRRPYRLADVAFVSARPPRGIGKRGGLRDRGPARA